MYVLWTDSTQICIPVFSSASSDPDQCGTHHWVMMSAEGVCVVYSQLCVCVCVALHLCSVCLWQSYSRLERISDSDLFWRPSSVCCVVDQDSSRTVMSVGNAHRRSSDRPLLLSLLLLSLGLRISAFNLDTSTVLVKEGEPGSFFGFSLALHQQITPEPHSWWVP